MYDTPHTLLPATAETPEMQITRLWPGTDWATVWKNLQAAPVPELTKATWYKVIHGVIPTNERLHKIRMTPTDNCLQCSRKNTYTHRQKECGNGSLIWGWTLQRIALILRTNPRQIPADWLLRPQFTLWPPQRHIAVLWILANMIAYRSQLRRVLTFHDYLDFLRTAEWMMYQKRS